MDHLFLGFTRFLFIEIIFDVNRLQNLHQKTIQKWNNFQKCIPKYSSFPAIETQTTISMHTIFAQKVVLNCLLIFFTKCHSQSSKEIFQAHEFPFQLIFQPGN